MHFGNFDDHIRFLDTSTLDENSMVEYLDDKRMRISYCFKENIFPDATMSWSATRKIKQVKNMF